MWFRLVFYRQFRSHSPFNHASPAQPYYSPPTVLSSLKKMLIMIELIHESAANDFWSSPFHFMWTQLIFWFLKNTQSALLFDYFFFLSLATKFYNPFLEIKIKFHCIKWFHSIHFKHKDFDRFCPATNSIASIALTGHWMNHLSVCVYVCMYARYVCFLYVCPCLAAH